jgi:dynein light chain LC8-type
MAERKPNIKQADISEDMQNDAVEVATKAIDANVIEKDIALQIKREFDKKHNPTWHCVVGRNFGALVVHESKHYIYFYLGLLLWKA